MKLTKISDNMIACFRGTVLDEMCIRKFEFSDYFVFAHYRDYGAGWRIYKDRVVKGGTACFFHKNFECSGSE